MSDAPRAKKRGEPLDPYKEPSKEQSLLEQRLREMSDALGIPYDPDEASDEDDDDGDE